MLKSTSFHYQRTPNQQPIHRNLKRGNEGVAKALPSLKSHLQTPHPQQRYTTKKQRRRVTAKWTRLTTVHAVPASHRNAETMASHENKIIRIYVVQMPGYWNHEVFLLVSGGGTTFTYNPPGTVSTSSSALLPQRCSSPSAMLITLPRVCIVVDGDVWDPVHNLGNAHQQRWVPQNTNLAKAASSQRARDRARERKSERYGSFTRGRAGSGPVWSTDAQNPSRLPCPSFGWYAVIGVRPNTVGCNYYSALGCKETNHCGFG